MIPTPIDQLLESFPGHTLQRPLRDTLESWRIGSAPAVDLLIGMRRMLSTATQDPIAVAWFRFETEVRRHSHVLTPYELSRLFGLETQFEKSAYRARNEMTRRLQVDCDFLEAELRAESERQRLASMTTDQRLEHDRQQGQERQRGMKMMQQFMHPQQDSFVSAAQAEARVPPPRKMLDRETRAALQARLRSQDIDFASQEALVLKAKDVEEAVLYARLLSHERSCDLFRGQPVNWPAVPSVLRRPIERGSDQRWQRFRDWATNQPALAELSRNQKQLAAIGQHYGIPTYLLDFSRNPRIAAFFATHTDIAPSAGSACIYCLWSGALDAAYHQAPASMRHFETVPMVERVDVDGLLRMQAQEGSFVCANQATWSSFFRMDVILFPRNQPVSSPTPEDIYPATKSEIEQLVAEYFAGEPSD